MAEVLLFHHALGLTAGCLAFAEELRAARHVVHTPDLYDGRTFTNVAAGVAHAEAVGFGTVVERGRRAADGMSDDVVYAGFSLGVMPAQLLAQTRSGARAALLFHACVPLSEFGSEWPSGVSLQIHTMEADGLGDLDVARDIAETVEDAELFLYPGEGHLFADSTTADHDEGAARLLMRRVLDFLARVDTAD